MRAYIGRRLLAMVVMLFALTVMTFGLFQVLPADPAALTCGKSCNPQVIAQNRIRLGYDRPVLEQYGTFLRGIVLGRTYGEGPTSFHCAAPCLGYSFAKQQDVRTLIQQRLPVTAVEASGAVVLWLVFGVGAGTIAARWRGQWQDRLSMGVSLVGFSFPTFFVAILLQYFVIFKFRLMDYPSYVSFGENPGGFLRAFILPWIALAAIYAAFYARLTRNQLLETLGEDYIRTARAKGVSERAVLGKHALRAGIGTVVTATGLDLAGMLGGAVVVEDIFALPGVGTLALDAVVNADLPLIMGTVLVAAALVIVANLVVDVLYAAMDPRVRLA